MAITWRTTDFATGATVSGLTNNNLTATAPGSSSVLTYLATVLKSSGKWYWEYSVASSTSGYLMVGLAAMPVWATINNIGYYPACLVWKGDSTIYQNNTQRYSAATVGVGPGNGIVGVAVDCATSKVWFAKNNTWIMSGNPATGANPVADPTVNSWWTWTPLIYAAPVVNGYVATVGQFESASQTYSPPSGFTALTDSTDYAWPLSAVLSTQLDIPCIHTRFGGTYRILGTVTELGVVGSYLVRLFHRLTGMCIGETWSAADGSYVFNELAYEYQGYYAIAYDHGDNPLNAAIADLITPELMP